MSFLSISNLTCGQQRRSAVLVTTLLVATAASFALALHMTFSRSGEDDDEDNKDSIWSDDNDDDDMDASKFNSQSQNVKFPWEPVSSDSGDEVAKKKPPYLFAEKPWLRSQSEEQHAAAAAAVTRQDSREQQQKQLEFLSTMTFANGGLRLPSCPCCI